MAKVFRIAILIACTLSAGRAFAAGGACPTGANYLNSSSGSLVTLSSLGVTSCYFIAANGSDANNGTSEGTPWLHAPGMPNCTNNCASITPTAGQGFIFRGGDTWHEGNSSASPYTGGEWSINSTNGSATNPIYFGVDQSWYSGSSWARPVITGDNPLCGPSLPSGCSTSTSGGYTQYYVSSCPYQVGTGNTLVYVGVNYQILDNFELTGLCSIASSSNSSSAADTHVAYGGPTYTFFYNLYIHGWSHTQFTCNAPTSCGFNIFAFKGGGGGDFDTLAYNVIDGSDSDASSAGQNYQGWWNASHMVIRYTAQGIVTNNHLFHDNLVEYQYENGHANVYESIGEPAANGAYYNNIFRHLSQGQIGGAGTVGVWLFPTVGYTDYFFNNIIYDINNTSMFDIGQNANGGNQGTIVFFNNIAEDNLGNGLFGCNSSFAHPFSANNNFYVAEISLVGIYGGSGSNCTPGSNDLVITHSTATTDGYTASQTYAYSPTSATSPTVGAGVNETTNYCAALSTAASSDSTLSDAAAACTTDTRYACTYNTGNHMVNCPARTAVARPSSGAWDVGAYQNSSTQASAPNAPTDLTATVQ
jgi:hypothetical protein